MIELSSVSKAQWAELAVLWMPRSLTAHVAQDIELRNNDDYGITKSADGYKIKAYFNAAERVITGFESKHYARQALLSFHYVSLFGEIKAPHLMVDEDPNWKPTKEHEHRLKVLLPDDMTEALDIYSLGFDGYQSVTKDWIDFKNKLLEKTREQL